MMNENLYLPQSDLWDYLKSTDKPVVLYGMGNGAEKVYNKLLSIGVAVSAVFASDEFVRGHSFLGYEVKKYSEICKMYGDFIVLLCFATSLKDVQSRIMQIASEHELYDPDVPVAGDDVFDISFAKSRYSLLNSAYQMLADDESRRVFQNVILFKLSGRLEYILSIDSEKLGAYRDILKISGHESFMDLGAYNGDTVRELLEFTGGKADSILAVEPDRRSFRKLSEYAESSNHAFITTVKCAVSNRNKNGYFSDKGGRMSSLDTSGKAVAVVKTVDALCEEYDFIPTYIKMDLEGEERNALLGAKQTLAAYKPKLLISAYHRNEDIFTLPILIHELCPGYRLYLRKHRYFPAWDLNIYGIAQDN